jgi:Zn-dependent oligopeptidase
MTTRRDSSDNILMDIVKQNSTERRDYITTLKNLDTRLKQIDDKVSLLTSVSQNPVMDDNDDVCYCCCMKISFV